MALNVTIKTEITAFLVVFLEFLEGSFNFLINSCDNIVVMVEEIDTSGTVGSVLPKLFNKNLVLNSNCGD